MELSLDAIGTMLDSESERLPKGYLFRNIYDFVSDKSEDNFALNITDLPLVKQMNTVKVSNLRSGTKRVYGEIAEKYTNLPTCKIAKDDKTVLLVNVAKYAAAVKKAEAAAAAEAAK